MCEVCVAASQIHPNRHAASPRRTLQGVCHRDLKLENTLLDGNPAPRLKICDFGYSKVRPASTPPARMACSRARVYMPCDLPARDAPPSPIDDVPTYGAGAAVAWRTPAVRL